MTHSLSILVAGVATLNADDPVLRSSLRLAGRLGATLHLVHAFTGAEEVAATLDVALHPSREGEYQQRLRERLERLVPDIGQEAIQVVCHALPGSPSEVLRDVAGAVGADLLLVGPTRHTRAGQAFLGTTAGRVIRQARPPVLVVRGSADSSAVTRVLLTADLSELSARVVASGVRVARELTGEATPEMRCLWVAEHDDKGTPFRLTEHQILKHALAKLHEFIGHQAPDASGITARVRLGNPTEQIVAEAREWQADLVVLGTHGRSGLPRLLLGSIAEATLRDAGCSALVIPNQGLTVTRPRPTAAEEYATV